MRIMVAMQYIVFVSGVALAVTAFSYPPILSGIRSVTAPHSAPNRSQVSNRTTWPQIPFNVKSNTSTQQTVWLHFSRGGRDLTSCHMIILDALLSSVIVEFTSNSSAIQTRQSTFGAFAVHLVTDRRNPTLGVAVYHNALVTLLETIRKWGAKELDVEIRLDPGDTLPLGDFHIRFANNVDNIPADTVDFAPTIFWKIPITCRASTKILSHSRSEPGQFHTALGNLALAATNNTRVTRLRNQTALIPLSVITTTQLVHTKIDADQSRTVFGPSRISLKYPWTGLSNSSQTLGVHPYEAFQQQSLITSLKTTHTGSYTTASSRVDSMKAGVPSTGDKTFGCSKISNSSIAYLVNSGRVGGREHSKTHPITAQSISQSPVSQLTIVEAVKSISSADTLSAHRLPTTSLSTPSSNHGNGSRARTTASTTPWITLDSLYTGSLDSTDAVKSLADDNDATTTRGSLIPAVGVIVPIPILRDPVAAALPPPPGSPGNGETEPEDPSLTSGSAPSDSSQTAETMRMSLSTTVPTQTSAPALNSFSITLSPTLSSSVDPSSRCSVCSACPTVAYAPNLGSVLGIDDDQLEGSSMQNKKRKALGGRFYVEKRDFQETPITILGRGTNGINGPSCTVKPYILRRNHPSPTDVSSWEGRPDMPNSMVAFFDTATYWAIPTELPNCGGPDVVFENTNNIEVPVLPGAVPYILRGRKGKKSVSIDHVYEVKLLDEFFTSRVDAVFNCTDVGTLFDASNYAEYDPASLDIVDTRLNTIFGQLARYAFPDFVGMDDSLNRLKGRLWAFPQVDQSVGGLRMQGLPIVLPDRGQENLEAIASITAVMILLNKSEIKQLFHNTNDRIYKAFAGIDEIINEAANPCNNIVPYLDRNNQRMKATWASAYKAWVTNRIAVQNRFVASTVATYSSQVPTVISPNVPINDHSRVPGWSTWMSNWNQNHGLNALTFPSISTWPEGSLNIQKRHEITTDDSCSAIVSGRPMNADVLTVESAAQTRVTAAPSPSQTSIRHAVTPTSNTPGLLSLPTSYRKVSTIPTGTTSSFEPPTKYMTAELTTGPKPLLSLPLRYSRNVITLSKHAAETIATTSFTATSEAPLETQINTSSSNDSSSNALCGPSYQDKPLYPNICNTTVNAVHSPAVYGAYCSNHPPTHSTNAKPIDYLNCNATYIDICAQMLSATSPRETWVWSAREPGCALGFYLPAGAGLAPSQKDCETLIFKRIVDICATTVPPSNFGSVNLLQPPSIKGDGSAVDDLFARYVVSPVPL